MLCASHLRVSQHLVPFVVALNASPHKRKKNMSASPDIRHQSLGDSLTDEEVRNIKKRLDEIATLDANRAKVNASFEEMMNAIHHINDPKGKPMYPQVPPAHLRVHVMRGRLNAEDGLPKHAWDKLPTALGIWIGARVSNKIAIPQSLSLEQAARLFATIMVDEDDDDTSHMIKETRLIMLGLTDPADHKATPASPQPGDVHVLKSIQELTRALSAPRPDKEPSELEYRKINTKFDGLYRIIAAANAAYTQWKTVHNKPKELRALILPMQAAAANGKTKAHITTLNELHLLAEDLCLDTCTNGEWKLKRFHSLIEGASEDQLRNEHEAFVLSTYPTIKERYDMMGIASFSFSLRAYFHDLKALFATVTSDASSTIPLSSSEDSDRTDDEDEDPEDEDEAQGGGFEIPPTLPARWVHLRTPDEVQLAPHTLRAEHLNTILDKTGWLHATTIDAYGSLLSQYCTDVLAIDSALSAQLIKGDKKEFPNTIVNKIACAEKILFPICHGNHWCLLIWNTMSNSIGLANSLTSCTPPVKKILEACAKATGRDLNVRIWGSPKQTNSHDCGVFTIAAMFAAAFELKFSFSQEDMPAMRTYTYRCLTKRKLFSPTWIQGFAPFQHNPRAAHDVVLVEAHFPNHAGAEAPRVAMEMASTLITLRLAPPTVNILEAMSKGTRSRHLNLLLLLQQHILMRPQLLALPLARAAIDCIQHLKTSKGWSPSTTATNAASLSGALSRLDQYSHPTCNPIPIGSTTIYKDFLKALAKKERTSRNLNLPCLTKEHLSQVLPLLPTREQLLLALTWAQAGRPTNTAALRAKDLLTEVNGEVQVVWCDPKTASLVGPYTITTAFPPRIQRALKEWVQSNQPETRLFQDHEIDSALNNIKEAIRRIAGSEFNLRAIRRGALTHLANQGVDETVLMQISGHTSVKTLRRYLGYGKHMRNRARATVEATKMLWQ